MPAAIRLSLPDARVRDTMRRSPRGESARTWYGRGWTSADAPLEIHIPKAKREDDPVEIEAPVAGLGAWLAAREVAWP